MTGRIEDSERMIALILSFLEPNGVYQSGISPSTFPEEDSQLFYGAFCWLRHEGYLYHESSSGLNYGGVALSSKGYAALNRQSFFGSDLSGSEVTKKVASGESPYSKAGEFLGALAGGLINTQK